MLKTLWRFGGNASAAWRRVGIVESAETAWQPWQLAYGQRTPYLHAKHVQIFKVQNYFYLTALRPTLLMLAWAELRAGTSYVD